MSRVVFYPLAQPAHMHIHRARVAGVVVAPDVLQEAVARQHQALVADQVDQEVEETRWQLDLPLATPHLVAIHINAQITGNQHPSLWWRFLGWLARRVGRRLLATAQ